MLYWILKGTARIISCTIVQRLTILEQQTIEWQYKMEDHNNVIHKKVEQVSNTKLKVDDIPKWNHSSLAEEDETFNDEFQKIMSDKSVPDVNDTSNILDDSGMNDNTAIDLPREINGEQEHAIVKRRDLDINGKPIGM